MKILILGAGAVGLTVAAKLSRVCDVHAVCRTPTANAIEAKGFHMTIIWGEDTYRFSASDHIHAGQTFDYVIITAKSQDTEAICRQYAVHIRDTETLSLQNGIGNEEIISGFTGRVIGGTIITGFEWRGAAAVHVSVEARPAKLGRFPEGLDEPVERLVGLLNKAGVTCEGSRTIRSELWSKTLYNCALNPLGAVTGLPYDDLGNPASGRIIENRVREAFAGIAAEGVPLPWRRAEDYLGYLWDVQLPATATHHSSMLQDLTRGRKTKIDFINGAVAAQGKKHGIPTPYNSCIVDLIRFRESLRGQGMT